MTEQGSRVWFITGTTSGFGRALVDAARARGERVVATARRLPDRIPAGLLAVVAQQPHLRRWVSA